MSATEATLADRLRARFGGALTQCVEEIGEVTVEVAPGSLLDVCRELRDDTGFAFAQLMDLCGVDYSAFGEAEWQTAASGKGFSRGVDARSGARKQFDSDETAVVARPRRFAVVSHLLSIQHNQRLRVRTYAPEDEVPVVPSVVSIWNSANWYEREAFDLFGIVFEGHPDLRRILTDYGFVGHAFRKDFPLIGNVEVRYDPDKRRVVYQPVTIEPRVLVPRVIRHETRRRETPAGDAENG